jgi:hypothetical protein
VLPPRPYQHDCILCRCLHIAACDRIGISALVPMGKCHNGGITVDLGYRRVIDWLIGYQFRGRCSACAPAHCCCWVGWRISLSKLARGGCGAATSVGGGGYGWQGRVACLWGGGPAGEGGEPAGKAALLVCGVEDRLARVESRLARPRRMSAGRRTGWRRRRAGWQGSVACLWGGGSAGEGGEPASKAMSLVCGAEGRLARPRRDG